MRIQSRIFIGFMVVLLIGFSSLLYWIVGDLKPQFRKATEEPLVDASRVLASVAATTARDGKIDPSQLRAAFKDAYSRPFSARIYGYTKTDVDYHVYVTDAKGKVVFDSLDGEDEGKDYSRWNDVKLTLEGRYGARTTQEVPDDPSSSVMYVAAPVIVDGKIIGSLSVGKPSGSVNQLAEDAKGKILIGGVIIGLSAILVGMFLSWRITAPINRLTSYARAVRDGVRADIPDLGGGETRELGAAFDEMRKALDGKEYVENYIQTLTHEIKSPISAIQGATELLTENPPPDKRDRFLSNIRDEAARVGDIVEKLLLLSSLEKMNHVVECKPLDMAELVFGVKESLYPVMAAKGVTLEVSGDKGRHFEGDPFLIRQAVTNLIQNAVDFSPRGGKVRADIMSVGHFVALLVRDHGEGIPAYAESRVFERFYSLKRPDTGRKSSGLGLCLVKEVAALHNGAVELVNAPDGGVLATLTLPVKRG